MLRKRLNIFNFICLIITAALLLWGNTTWNKTPLAYSENTKNPAKLIYVIDGDTIVVNIQEREEHVRLIGIDAPESRPNEKAFRNAHNSNLNVEEINALGERSSNYLKSLLRRGDAVSLEFDVNKRDKYQRLLAYVYLNDGSMLNEKLLEDGYASLYSFPPDIKYEARLKKAYSNAGRNKRGLWQ